MNKLQRIEEMERQLAALRAEVEQEAKPKQWEPKGGSYKYHVTGNMRSRALADKSLDALHSYNRLLAYKAEFDADFVPDWGSALQGKYYVYFDNDIQKFSVSRGELYQNISCVYFSEQAAKGLARKLNSGEVVL